MSVQASCRSAVVFTDEVWYSREMDAIVAVAEACGVKVALAIDPAALLEALGEREEPELDLCGDLVG